MAVVVAGVLGIVHDQISYTVSSEYYTRFKFPQFRMLDPSVPERVRAGIVGFLASWWMGIPVGLLTGVAGLIHRDALQMRRALLLSLLVVIGFTFAFALCGLAYGLLDTANLDLSDYPHWFVPAGLEEPRRFICAGCTTPRIWVGCWRFQ